VLTTLKVGYGTRLALSALCMLTFTDYRFLHVFLVPDLFMGYLSVEFVSSAVRHFPGGDGFLSIFLMTIVEGALWNITLMIYMSLIYGVQRLFRRKSHANHCVHCGYDLRASANICPECGTRIGETSPAHASTIR
jgi:hypothetical protein